MKQNINIEYTEEEFKSIFGFFTHFVDTGASLFQTAMRIDSERRESRNKENKIEDIKSKVEEQNDNVEDLRDDMKDLKTTLKDLRTIKRDLANLNQRLDTLELDDEHLDDATPGDYNHSKY